jgi:hypothetical protein
MPVSESMGQKLPERASRCILNDIAVRAQGPSLRFHHEARRLAAAGASATDRDMHLLANV